MMNSIPATSEEIAYVRKLAESGVRAPLLGGRFMLWWGTLLPIAYVAHHLALKGAIGDGSSIFPIIWLGFVALGVAGQMLLARTMPAKAGAGSAGNRASRSVWFAGAGAISSMIVGTAVAAARGAGPATFDWIVPVGFAAYACALIVTGALAQNRLSVAAGIGAILMVGLFTSFILDPDRYLAAAAGVALTVALPGLLLMRAEPPQALADG
jgi:hypothetical protein